MWPCKVEQNWSVCPSAQIASRAHVVVRPPPLELLPPPPLLLLLAPSISTTLPPHAARIASSTPKEKLFRIQRGSHVNGGSSNYQSVDLERGRFAAQWTRCSRALAKRARTSRTARRSLPEASAFAAFPRTAFARCASSGPRTSPW